MTLRHLTLGQIDESQLQHLIGGKASETRDIECKRDAYGIAYKDHGKFVADLSPFANANGGSRSSTIRRMAFGRVRLGSVGQGRYMVDGDTFDLTSPGKRPDKQPGSSRLRSRLYRASCTKAAFD